MSLPFRGLSFVLFCFVSFFKGGGWGRGEGGHEMMGGRRGGGHVMVGWGGMGCGRGVVFTLYLAGSWTYFREGNVRHSRRFYPVD